MKKIKTSILFLGAFILMMAAFGVGVALRAVQGETRQKITAHSQHLHSTGLESQALPPLLEYIPTYYQHVKPILETNCLTCHQAGGIAPIALNTAKAATTQHRQIYLATRAKRMPPFPPGGESPAFKHDMRLSPNEIAILANWSWAGAPIGDAKKAVSGAPRTALILLRADRVLPMPKSYQPNSELSDDYRCFMLNPELTTERIITGYDVQAGNARAVHHVLLFEVRANAIPAVRQLEATQGDGKIGYDCFGGSRVAGGLEQLGAWAPGSPAIRFPEGIGVRLRAGSQVLIQVHYNLANGSDVDQSTVKLELAPPEVSLKSLQTFSPSAPVELPCAGEYPSDPENRCHRQKAFSSIMPTNPESYSRRAEQLLKNCSRNLSDYIKPSDATQIETSCEYTAPFNLTIQGLAGHMHYLGKSVKLELHPNSSKRQTLLEIPNWDFHWQGFYWFQNPVVAQRGDTFRITCVFDNSQANQPFIGGAQRKPKYVVWGEGTEEEMCLGFIQVTAN